MGRCAWSTWDPSVPVYILKGLPRDSLVVLCGSEGCQRYVKAKTKLRVCKVAKALALLDQLENDGLRADEKVYTVLGDRFFIHFRSPLTGDGII